MFSKLNTNGAIASYGPSFPSTVVADGTMFYKTTGSTNYPAGWYIYGTKPDVDAAQSGPQVGQTWFPADSGDQYVRISGSRMTGQLGVSNWVKIYTTSEEQRLIMGNSASIKPIIFSAYNKILKIGLGTTFSSTGGTLTPLLQINFETKEILFDGNKLWHAGNDGPNSGLDADSLDGAHGSVTSTANTVAIRDSASNVSANSLILSTPNDASTDASTISQFLTFGKTTNSIGVKSSVSQVREAIRLDSSNDVNARKIWNIDISGKSASTDSVSWANITNKPTWLTNGIDWADITNKPKTIYKYGDPGSPVSTTLNALDLTSNGKNDVFSGMYIYSNVTDSPRINNTFPDPNNGVTFPEGEAIDAQYWIGMQTINKDNRTGFQMLARWDAEDASDNGSDSFNDRRAYLMFRINDDNGVSNPQSNGFSPWIKVWTNTSLTKVSQLVNDVGYVSTTTSNENFLSKVTTDVQSITGPIIFSSNFTGGSNAASPTMGFNVATGEIWNNDSFTAKKHFQTTNGDHYTQKGRIYTNEGMVGAGQGGVVGAISMYPGYNGPINSTGQLFLTNSDGAALFRLSGDLTNRVAYYEMDPAGAYGLTTAQQIHSFKGTIKCSGDIFAYASDATLKTNVEPIQNAIQKVKQIGGYTYNWRKDICAKYDFHPTNNVEHGLVAQEVQKVIPDAVSSSAISKDLLTINYSRIVPLLSAAIIEQQVQIETLTKQNAEFVTRLEKLEQLIASIGKA